MFWAIVFVVLFVYVIYKLINFSNDLDRVSQNKREAEEKEQFQNAVLTGTVEDVRSFVEEKEVDVNTKWKDHPNFQGFYDFTPLHYAASHNSNVEVLEYLISKGAMVNAKTSGSTTPLHCAALGNSNLDIIKCLISHGADVNAKDREGWTPLHWLASRDFQVFSPPNNVKFFEYLISHGADVNAKDNDGFTALHRIAALEEDGVDVLKLLISKGADVYGEAGGETPLDLASSEEKKRILHKAMQHKGIEITKDNNKSSNLPNRVVDLLCDSCRKIHPVKNDGSRDINSLENIFGSYELQPSNIAIMTFVLPTLRDNLQLFGGCSRCIESVESVIARS